MIATTVKFTPEEALTLQRAAYAVWDECAYDLLTAVAEERRKDVNAVTVPRSTAIEIALDAGRMEQRLATSGAPAELMEKIRAADYKTLIKTVRPAFSYARYGM